MGFVIEVRGKSMSPQLRDGDLLWAENIHDFSPKIGELVVLKSKNSEYVVHRFLSKSRVKGDRCKEFDFLDQFEIKALVRGRILGDIKSEGEIPYFSSANKIYSFLSRLQAFVSLFNLVRVRKIHRIADIVLGFNGSLLRLIEQKVSKK